MKFRRIVTGHDTHDRSRIVDDATIGPDQVTPTGAELLAFWGADSSPRHPESGERPGSGGWFPPPGGYRFFSFVLPPGEGADYHRTQTVDLIYVAAGEIELILDEDRTTVSAGETIIQNGTNHGWRNPGREPCVLVGVLIGARQVHD